MVFNAVSALFQLCRGGLCTYPCFTRVLLISAPKNIRSKPLAAFPHNHCRNNGQQSETVVMSIINSRKEYRLSRGSNQRPHALKSCSLPTEPRPGSSVVSVSDSWPGGCEFDPRLMRFFFRRIFASHLCRSM